MDPIALAVLGGFTAFNQFLCTPPGQKFAELNIDLIGKLMTHFGVHLTADTPATPKA